jgi:hypothetical protein
MPAIYRAELVFWYFLMLSSANNKVCQAIPQLFVSIFPVLGLPLTVTRNPLLRCMAQFLQQNKTICRFMQFADLLLKAWPRAGSGNEKIGCVYLKLDSVLALQVASASAFSWSRAGVAGLATGIAAALLLLAGQALHSL